MAATIKLYKITRTKCYQMREQGTGYSLEPWNGNTADYEGYDDGGADYTLFDGFSVEETATGGKAIYDSDGTICFLTVLRGKPCLYKPDPDGVGDGKHLILSRTK